MFGFLDALKLAAGLLAGVALSGVYDKFVDDPAVRREARAGYVLVAEKAAADATAQELLRQRDAASRALQSFRDKEAADAAADAQREKDRENEILAYEIRLSQANRRCSLDADDIDVLRNQSR